MALISAIDCMLGEDPSVERLSEAAEVVLRPDGWEAQSDEAQTWLKSIRRPNHVYRGMEDAEYRATVGKGKPVQSTGAYSYAIEGTNFATDPSDATAYVNFGRSDPRKSGKPNWLVEVKRTSTMYVDTDRYVKDREPVDTVTRVWKLYARAGAIWAKKVK